MKCLLLLTGPLSLVSFQGTNAEENTVLRKNKDRAELHNDKIRNLYSSANIIDLVKSRTVKWIGHSTIMRNRKYL
jgi:hypothetical protein